MTPGMRNDESAAASEVEIALRPTSTSPPSSLCKASGNDVDGSGSRDTPGSMNGPGSSAPA